jgi:hypothetical protein
LIGPKLIRQNRIFILMTGQAQGHPTRPDAPARPKPVAPDKASPADGFSGHTEPG